MKSRPWPCRGAIVCSLFLESFPAGLVCSSALETRSAAGAAAGATVDGGKVVLASAGRGLPGLGETAEVGLATGRSRLVGAESAISQSFLAKVGSLGPCPKFERVMYTILILIYLPHPRFLPLASHGSLGSSAHLSSLHSRFTLHSPISLDFPFV